VCTHSFLFSQLSRTMCNSSFVANDSTVFSQDVSWFCMCQGHFGPVVIVSLAMLCFTVGTPVHCWSLWVFLHGTFKPNMVFPLNITILELLFCIQCFTDFIDFMYSSRVSYILCTFLIGLSWTFRPLIQIFTCIEQYLAVIYPLTFLRYKGIHYRIALVAAAWIIAVGNSLRLVSNRITYFQDHVYFLFFCIAVMITSFCCKSVLRALESPGPGKQKNTDRGRAVENQQKRKALRIISHILVSILVCYLPHVVAYFMCMAKTSTHTFLCKIVPSVLSISSITLLISPLVRMYNDGQLKHIVCFSKA